MTHTEAVRARHMSATLVNLTVAGSVCCAVLVLLQVLLARFVFDATSASFTNMWLYIVPIALMIGGLAAAALAGSLRASIWAIAFGLLAFLATLAVAIWDLLDKLGKNGRATYRYVNDTRIDIPSKITVVALTINWAWVLLTLLSVAAAIAVYRAVRSVYTALNVTPDGW